MRRKRARHSPAITNRPRRDRAIIRAGSKVPAPGQVTPCPGRTRTSDTRFRKPLLNGLNKGLALCVRLPNGSRIVGSACLERKTLAVCRGSVRNPVGSEPAAPGQDAHPAFGGVAERRGRRVTRGDARTTRRLRAFRALRRALGRRSMSPRRARLRSRVGCPSESGARSSRRRDRRSWPCLPRAFACRARSVP